MKKVAKLGITIMLAGSIMLTSCGVDKEVKVVIKQIDALDIDTLTLDSKDDIQAAVDAYLALTEEQKEKVENRDELKNISDKFEQLSKDDFVRRLSSYTFENVEALQNDMHDYWDILTEEEKKETLINLGRCKIEPAIEEKIKSYLKSPRSFYMYSYEESDIRELGDVCSSIVTVEFGATNSFGGEVTKTVTVFVDYEIDMENQTANIINMMSTDFLSWELGL